MPKISIETLTTALLRKHDTGWPSHQRLKALGCTERQILRFRQSGKTLSCSHQTADLIKMYATADKRFFYTFAKIISAKALPRKHPK